MTLSRENIRALARQSVLVRRVRKDFIFDISSASGIEMIVKNMASLNGCSSHAPYRHYTLTCAMPASSRSDFVKWSPIKKTLTVSD